MIRAVIFDKDGTLFDFRQSWGDWAARLLADLAGDEAERALSGLAEMGEKGEGEPAARAVAAQEDLIGRIEAPQGGMGGAGGVESRRSRMFWSERVVRGMDIHAGEARQTAK